MCGIVGIIAKNDIGKDNIPKLKNAVNQLNFRGPDANGIWEHRNVALAHARLSIIDTSSAASQPFISSDKRYCLVFNGEIYNYKELRAKLISKGQKFTTNSDTEVLLYHLIENGADGLKELNGFFSFILYDNETGNSIVARDRFGIKPLVIYEDENQIIFGSELKAIMAFDIDKTINLEALKLYFKFNYIPQPFSILKKCRKLKPGHFLTIQSDITQEGTYYKLQINHKDYGNWSYADAQIKLRELLEKSVADRLVADVPIGAFLSGGIDSSVIVALASKHTKNLNTFSIGYKDEPLFDETKYAQLVAKKYKTNHTVFKLTNDDLFNQLEKVLDYTDEPFADSSGLAVNILSMHTKKEATVALSGDGADEIFSGYNKHMAEYLAREKNLKNTLVKAGKPLWEILPKSRNSAIGNINRQLLKFAKGTSLSNKDRYWLWAGIMEDQNIDNLIKHKNSNDLSKYKSQILSDELNSKDFNGVLFQDVHQVLTSDMLTKVDLNSMSNSLEVRVPFLDHHVVDFAFSIPPEYKIGKGIKKKILQETFKEDLPSELFKRPKHGFEVPLLKWFRGPLKNKIEKEYLNRDFIEAQNLFNWHAIQAIIQKLYSSNPEDSAAQIWALIVFQHWWKKWNISL